MVQFTYFDNFSWLECIWLLLKICPSGVLFIRIVFSIEFSAWPSIPDLFMGRGAAKGKYFWQFPEFSAFSKCNIRLQLWIVDFRVLLPHLRCHNVKSIEIGVGSDILIPNREVGGWGKTYNWSILLLQRKGEVSGLTLRTCLSRETKKQNHLQFAETNIYHLFKKHCPLL